MRGRTGGAAEPIKRAFIPLVQTIIANLMRRL
jgi:hypothetical protein